MNLDDVRRLTDELSLGYLEEQRLLPLEQADGRVRLACAGEPDPQALAEIESLFGARVETVGVDEDELLAAARRAYGRQASTPAEFIAGLEPGEAGRGEDTTAVGRREDGGGESEPATLADDAPVVRLVNLLLSEAVEAGASDVHLESEDGGVRVRYRIDGVLQDGPSPPAGLRSGMISRLKIMAELDIAERRMPQDGRIHLRRNGGKLDVRVSTLPTLHGESVVLRLLDAEQQRHDLESLGMAPDTLSAVRRFADRPQGVFLATGPTGSGKTTTLYAIVERINTGAEKIVSVEDPVEYELPGVAQVPVRPGVGLSFACALRSILRHDPDILLVGEMRDPETAEICIQAAMTGHLVLSTLHTNDAPSALTRLVDLGVPDYLVASTLEGVLAQRLVRTVCPGCAAEEPAGEAVRRQMARDGREVEAVRRGRGCERCRGSGYRGRTGIFELLEVDEAIRARLLRRRGSNDIRSRALEKGMRRLRADGWRQVEAGRTTPEEVLRVADA